MHNDADNSTVKPFDFLEFFIEEDKVVPSAKNDESLFPDFGEDKTPDYEDIEFLNETFEDEENLPNLREQAEELMKEAETTLETAKAQAEEIIRNAQVEALEIKNTAYAEAKDEGYNDGFNKAYEENKLRMEEGTMMFLLQLKDLIEHYEKEKNSLITNSIEDLKDISIAISEKIIQVSLKASSDIIKKMIISATEKMRYKEWAKIYISKNEASILIEGNSDLLKALSHVSEHIKFVVMEDSPSGTCIIEFPDQVIDVSTATQIENIKGALKGVGINRGAVNV